MHTASARDGVILRRGTLEECEEAAMHYVLGNRSYQHTANVRDGEGKRVSSFRWKWQTKTAEKE